MLYSCSSRDVSLFQLQRNKDLRMSQLILIAALEDGPSINKLIDGVRKTFSVQHVWMDPYNESRAVVHFDKKLELEDFKTKSSTDSVVEITRSLELTKPTRSVFVKTFKSVSFGVQDKLKYLFTSQKYGGRPVIKVEQLNTTDGDCYEISFLNWDDVLTICNGTWTVEKQKFTVIPFFDSFKEPFKQQQKRLIDFNSTVATTKGAVPSFATQNAVSFSNVIVGKEDSRNAPAVKQMYLQSEKLVDSRCAKPILEHPYILILLHLLNFEKAVQEKYNTATVSICVNIWEVEISGPITSVKEIQKLLTEEDELYCPTRFESFLGNYVTLQNLKTIIDTSGLYVDIVDTNGKPALQVRSGDERKGTAFHDFISTLVIAKECYPLPSKEYQEQTRWTKFIESFKSTHTHQQILVDGTSVTLVSLALKSQDMDLSVNMINDVITTMKKGLEIGPVLDENNQTSKNISSVKEKESVKTKVLTLCPQNCALLRMINVLNLRKSLKQKTNSLDVVINEDEVEITIRGSEKLVQKLKSVLMKEDRKFQFTDEEQIFLCDPVIQESLHSCLVSHECCIVLNDDLELSVASKDQPEVPFREFFTSFIHFTKGPHLAEEFQTTEEWNSFVQSVKNNYRNHHILTAEDMVYILSIASSKRNPEIHFILQEVNKKITALTSPVLSEHSISFAEELSSQIDEHMETDSYAVSVADEHSKKAVSLYCKHSLLLWILNSLQLKESAQKIEVFVTFYTDDDDDNKIVIKGPTFAVDHLRSALIKEDNEFQFTEEEQIFLWDPAIRKSLHSCLISHGCCIVLNDAFEMSVASEDGPEVPFREFLTNFIHFTKGPHLAEEFQTSKEWNSLIENVRNNYQHHHIFTADDTVYILSVASSEKNDDINFLLQEINKTITALTSPVLPEHHASFAEELSGQRDEHMETDSYAVSVADENSKKAVSLYCKHSLLLWILNSLQLKEAAQKIGVCVTFHNDDDDNKIIIEGFKIVVDRLQSVLVREDNEMPFEDYEELFTNAWVRQRIDFCLKESAAQLVLNSNLELFVRLKSGMKEHFRAFITQFIIIKNCYDLPEKYQKGTEWKKLVEQLVNQHSHHQILINGEEVHLLTIALGDEAQDVNKVVNRINKFILSCKQHDSHENAQTEGNYLDITHPKTKIKYLHQFMNSEFQHVVNSLHHSPLEITLLEDNLHIFSYSQAVTNEVASQLKKLIAQIKCEKKEYTFPGISEYLKSTGSSIVNELSNKYKCLIEVQDMRNSEFQHLSVNEEKSSEIPHEVAYSVIFLGSAKCGGFNIHLVQGDMDRLKLEMKITLQPSEQGDICSIKGNKSSQNLVIYLPPWDAQNVDNDHSHLEKLRTSFRYMISLALDQAKAINHFNIAISTTNLTEPNHPFPASVVAKETIAILFEKNGLNLASQTEHKTVDFYICDLKNEAVFKAFTFFLKVKNVHLSAPLQAAWDSVCFPDSYEYPDYNSRGIEIKVSPNIPFSLGNNTCVFYPIHPSLDINSCPAVKENFYSEKPLTSSINSLQRQHPDGLIVGDIVPLNGFNDSRKSFVYCSPEWGVDCDKAVELILLNCIKKSSHCETMYIIPPGLQLQSKYPLHYLVQIFFRTLDNLMFHIGGMKRTVLLVQDERYQKLFNQELQRRYPRKKSVSVMSVFKSIYSYLISSTSEEKENSGKEFSKMVTKHSKVPSTVLTFWSNSDFGIQNAAMELERHLNQLMEETSITKHLNKEETLKLNKHLQNIRCDVPVQISITEHYETKCESKKKKKEKQSQGDKTKPSSSVIKINGLHQMYVDEFLVSANLIRDTEKTGKQSKYKDVQEESKASTKISVKVSEDSVSCEKLVQEKSNTSTETSVKVPEHSESCKRRNKKEKNNSKSSQQNCSSTTELAQSISHEWLFEPQSDGYFTFLGKISAEIDNAYSEKKKDLKLSGKYTSVDFSSMTVHKNEEKLGIIRVENFDGQSYKQEKPKVSTLPNDSEVFKKLERELGSTVEKYNLSLVEVCKVQNQQLQNRFNKKQTELNVKEYAWMWHRPLNRYKESVCRHGFHPLFSEMTKAQDLGEGVLFYKEPEKCLHSKTEAKEKIYLVYCKVLLGESGPGAPGLRQPPLDETTGKCFHSVSNDEGYMIFSDAQACPEHLIALEVK